MDFSLTDHQRQFQDGVNKALARISPLDSVRAQAGRHEEFPVEIWQGLSELGIPGALVPEQYGGLGFGLLDVALIAEMLGKYCVPAPFLGASVLAPLAVSMAGTEAQKTALLPDIAAGRLRIAVGLSEAAAGARQGAGLACNGRKLSGQAAFVIDSAGAHKFLVADRGGGLHLVERDAPGLEVVALETVDRSRTVAMLMMDGADAEPLADQAHGVLRRLVDAARLTIAADMLGAAWHMLNRAVEYAKLREQFGRPIGTFQAVKHMCAEMAAELEPGRAIIWYGGYALDQNRDDATLCVLHAKSVLAEASRFVARTATEVHGGMGITDSLGLHYWFKRVGWSYQALGTPERLREEAALLQGLIARPGFNVGAAPAWA